MSELKQWFEEASTIKVYSNSTQRYVMRKGFKITHYLEDDTYTILDTRLNDFYTEVSEADMKIFMNKGFVKGTNIIMYGRNVARVKSYLSKIADLYTKKVKYKGLLTKNKPFYTKQLKNCDENIHKNHEMMQFYKAQVEQFEKSKQFNN